MSNSVLNSLKTVRYLLEQRKSLVENAERRSKAERRSDAKFPTRNKPPIEAVNNIERKELDGVRS